MFRRREDLIDPLPTIVCWRRLLNPPPSLPWWQRLLALLIGRDV